MNDKCLAAVKIDQDLCSRCGVCYSICPFDAIDRQPDGGEVSINIQKCQVCGICYSACPVTAIEMAYYDYEGLLDLSRTTNAKAETLVMMCRGNSPSSGEVDEILASNGLSTKDHISMRIPCAGRVPTDFVFNALRSGIKHIVSIQCQDGFCRMKEGTMIETRRMLLGLAVLRQLGYPEDSLKVVKYSRKAVWISKDCVGCGKCVFICPYDAIKAEPFSSPTIDVEKCVGCGACQMVCPQHAIQVKGYEFETVLAAYGETAVKLKARNDQPSVLVFSCQWSEFSALDDPEKLLRGKNTLILEVPCFKGMDPVHVINAFQQGFDGVMAVVCSADDCKLKNGRDTAERQLDVLHNTLRKLGLLDRFEIHELSPRCEGEFTMKFEAFCQKIAAMTPSAAGTPKEVK